MNHPTPGMPATPAEAVQQVASQHGYKLKDHIAKEIADAALAQCDTKVGFRQQAHRLQWEDENYQRHLLKRMRRELFEGAVEQGLIPAALPTEWRQYYAAPQFFGVPDQEIPAKAIEAGADWESMVITLTMPVRRAEAPK